MAHANARLTPAGRLLLCQCVAAGRSVARVASELGISRACAYCWWAPLPAARPGRPATTGPAPPTPIPGACPPASRPRSPTSAGSASSARHGSRRWSAGRPPPSTASFAGWASTGWPSWTGQPVGSSAATNAPTPASCSTSMSRSSAGCVPAVATASAAGRPPSTGSAPPDRAAARATTMSTPLWTTTPGWPTWRSPGRRAGRDLRGVPAPRRGVLRRPRHHHPVRADRQRPRLPRRPWLPPDRRRTRR